MNIVLLRIITFIFNILIYFLFCTKLQNGLLCEIIYIVGMLLFSLLFYLKQQKTYQQIAMICHLFAIYGLKYIENNLLSGVLLVLFVISLAFLYRYQNIKNSKLN